MTVKADTIPSGLQQPWANSLQTPTTTFLISSPAMTMPIENSPVNGLNQNPSTPNMKLDGNPSSIPENSFAVDQQDATNSIQVQQTEATSIQNLNSLETTPANNQPALNTFPTNNQPTTSINNVANSPIVTTEPFNNEIITTLNTIANQPLAITASINDQPITFSNMPINQPLVSTGPVNIKPFSTSTTIVNQPLVAIESTTNQRIIPSTTLASMPLAIVDSTNSQLVTTSNELVNSRSVNNLPIIDSNTITSQPLVSVGSLNSQLITNSNDVISQLFTTTWSFDIPRKSRFSGISNSPLAAVWSVNNQSIATTNSISNLLLANSDSIKNQQLIDANFVNTQQTSSYDTLSNQILTAYYSINQQPVTTSNVIYNQPLITAGSINNGFVTISDGLENQQLAVVGLASPQPTYTYSTIDNQPLAVVGTVNNQPLYDPNTVNNQPIAVTGSANYQPITTADILAAQPLVAMEPSNIQSIDTTDALVMQPLDAKSPVNTEPIATEPIATEPVNTEPVNTEPVNTEPVNTEPVNTEPVNTEPVNTEPVNTEPVNTEPVNTEPVNTEPVNTEPVNTEPVNTEPVNTEPVNTEPIVTVDVLATQQLVALAPSNIQPIIISNTLADQPVVVTGQIDNQHFETENSQSHPSSVLPINYNTNYGVDINPPNSHFLAYSDTADNQLLNEQVISSTQPPNAIASNNASPIENISTTSSGNLLENLNSFPSQVLGTDLSTTQDKLYTLSGTILSTFSATTQGSQDLFMVSTEPTQVYDTILSQAILSVTMPSGTIPTASVLFSSKSSKRSMNTLLDFSSIIESENLSSALLSSESEYVASFTTANLSPSSSEPPSLITMIPDISVSSNFKPSVQYSTNLNSNSGNQFSATNELSIIPTLPLPETPITQIDSQELNYLTSTTSFDISNIESSNLNAIDSLQSILLGTSNYVFTDYENAPSTPSLGSIEITSLTPTSFNSYKASSSATLIGNLIPSFSISDNIIFPDVTTLSDQSLASTNLSQSSTLGEQGVNEPQSFKYTATNTISSFQGSSLDNSLILSTVNSSLEYVDVIYTTVIISNSAQLYSILDNSQNRINSFGPILSTSSRHLHINSIESETSIGDSFYTIRNNSTSDLQLLSTQSEEVLSTINANSSFTVSFSTLTSYDSSSFLPVFSATSTIDAYNTSSSQEHFELQYTTSMPTTDLYNSRVNFLSSLDTSRIVDTSKDNWSSYVTSGSDEKTLYSRSRPSYTKTTIDNSTISSSSSVIQPIEINLKSTSHLVSFNSSHKSTQKDTSTISIQGSVSRPETTPFISSTASSRDVHSKKYVESYISSGFIYFVFNETFNFTDSTTNLITDLPTTTRVLANCTTSINFPSQTLTENIQVYENWIHNGGTKPYTTHHGSSSTGAIVGGVVGGVGGTLLVVIVLGYLYWHKGTFRKERRRNGKPRTKPQIPANRANKNLNMSRKISSNPFDDSFQDEKAALPDQDSSSSLDSHLTPPATNPHNSIANTSISNYESLVSSGETSISLNSPSSASFIEPNSHAFLSELI
ncbi:hypothetical protein TBLA_0B09680 [Henningerozyma blattae CBS 6284]|uniref:Uncharacterized protein n=1 Tax=Henningerozyma blattae (strain ATCC 34711 / CBS 6284 / DSM 70876 / NBRC 10599 / NRRL Y-10934 / UCD 77-7) TaxID=1071380 RepID=I2H082_HENB6|nr:hypothetical protein TBLA_0B09680 [Tetrapisispora blattae CBS 6284]CCH59784.1 hypothetical protein TBLA_0B09680 [Tetrapisispora blattae CBS 6284]